MGELGQNCRGMHMAAAKTSTGRGDYGPEGADRLPGLATDSRPCVDSRWRGVAIAYNRG
jgi:hypothetical protein